MLAIVDLIGKPFEQIKCWDLVHEIYLRLGVDVGNYTEYDYSYTANMPNVWESIVQPELYCLCLFALAGKEIDHVGVYIGGGKIIHATAMSGVCAEDLSRYKRFARGMYKYGGDLNG